MKTNFGNITLVYINNRIKNDLGKGWEVSLTSKGNIKISNPNADKHFTIAHEYFVISLYKDKYYIRRYADYLDRCYRICPVDYKKVTFEGYDTSYIEKIYGFDNYNDALNAFIKFINKNRYNRS